MKQTRAEFKANIGNIDSESAFSFALGKNNFPSIRIELNWKAVHGVLSVKARLYRFKIIRSPICNFCTEIENIYHLFIDCTFAKSVWKEVDTFLRSLGIDIEIDYDVVIYNFLPDINKSTDKSTILTIINIAKAQIWQHRNHNIFRNKHTPPRVIFRYILKELH